MRLWRRSCLAAVLGFNGALALAEAPNPAKGIAARFTAINRSRYVIHAIYACRPREATWGSNLIEGRVLKPTQEIAVDLKDGCGVYDLRFVADDGIEFLDDEVSFCAGGVAGADAAEELIVLGRANISKGSRRPSPAAGLSQSGGRQ